MRGEIKNVSKYLFVFVVVASVFKTSDGYFFNKKKKAQEHEAFIEKLKPVYKVIDPKNEHGAPFHHFKYTTIIDPECEVVRSLDALIERNAEDRGGFKGD